MNVMNLQSNPDSKNKNHLLELILKDENLLNKYIKIRARFILLHYIYLLLSDLWQNSFYKSTNIEWLLKSIEERSWNNELKDIFLIKNNYSESQILNYILNIDPENIEPSSLNIVWFKRALKDLRDNFVNSKGYSEDDFLEDFKQSLLDLINSNNIKKVVEDTRSKVVNIRE